MADSVRITIEADDKTAAGIASTVANLGKIEKAASAANQEALGEILTELRQMRQENYQNARAAPQMNI